MSIFLLTRKSSDLHGDGLFSDRNVRMDETLFIEPPLLFLQSVENRQDVLVCANCYKFVGNIGIQLAISSKQINRSQVNRPDYNFSSIGLKLSDIVCCSHYCGEVYCSELCKVDHWKKCHHCLCTGLISEV